ncbi:glycosyltransferase [Flavobacterium sp.]|uniref:glycosyltransferase n=1 Tax=Flavobacterium sp. TaxID=239 RepID=UPI00374FE966
MKKKILFVIPSLQAGGGEKSLINLLHTIDFNKFKVDLVLLNKSGIFLKLVPSQVTIITLNDDYNTFVKSIFLSVIGFIKQGKISLAISRILFTINNNFIKNLGKSEQKSWKYLSKSITKLPTQYDTAIGFLEKSSIYFAVDCASAKKKIGFIHNDYTKLDLDASFDAKYFHVLTTIATVSEECAAVLKKTFPSQSNKVEVIYNIVSSAIITKLANDKIEIDQSQPILLSIGRLHAQKGFDFAIDSAQILKQNKVPFKWLIIGEGAERISLEKAIHEKDLKENFILLGLKENPYPYLKAATIYVQPSRYEGKSIAIDEAKILNKPILVTNFSTAKDQISDTLNGLIVAIDAVSIANGIQHLLENETLRHTLSSNLKKEELGTESEIDKLYSFL